MTGSGSELKMELNNESNHIRVKKNTNIVMHPNAAIAKAITEDFMATIA